MKIKESVLEAVVEELETENTFTLSDISVPDETISAPTNENESVKHKDYVEQGDQFNPLLEYADTENEICNDTIIGYSEKEHEENGKTEFKDKKGLSHDKTSLHMRKNNDEENNTDLQHHTVTVVTIAEDSSSSGQSPSKSVNSSSAFAQTNGHIDGVCARNPDKIKDSRNTKFSIRKQENGNGINYQDDNEKSRVVLELTRDNVKHYTKTFENDSHNYQNDQEPLLRHNHVNDSKSTTTIFPKSETSTLREYDKNNSSDTIESSAQNSTILPKNDINSFPENIKSVIGNTVVRKSIKDSSNFLTTNTSTQPNTCESNDVDSTAKSSSDASPLKLTENIVDDTSVSDAMILLKSDTSVQPNTSYKCNDEKLVEDSISDCKVLHKKDVSAVPKIVNVNTDETSFIVPELDFSNVDTNDASFTKKKATDDEGILENYVDGVRNHNGEDAQHIETEFVHLDKLSKHSKKNHRKKPMDLENVETLVSKDIKRKSNKRVSKAALCSGTSTSQCLSQVSKFSRKEHGEGNYSKKKESNKSFSTNCDTGGVNQLHVDQEEKMVKHCRTSGHKRLLNRERHHNFQRRLPVYDVNSTSTKMILLNNKYGKNSRLWTNQDCRAKRGTRINPLRHQKEPSFYLSGNFHSRCSTSEETLRPCFKTMLTKFDFSDRPQSDKIGDRLYEVKTSVNPDRHRSCRCTLPSLSLPMDFSPPTLQERSKRYVFAWERLYSEPQPRPMSAIRPHSSISGKKVDYRVVKVPIVLVASSEKETATL